MRTLSEALYILARRAEGPVPGWSDACCIMSGFRGPDDAKDEQADYQGPGQPLRLTTTERLKWLTTARIRAVVLGMVPEDDSKLDHHIISGASLQYLNGLVVRADPLSEEEMEERDRMLRQGSLHFRNHYIGAVTSIKRTYGYCLAYERLYCKEHLLEGAGEGSS